MEPTTVTATVPLAGVGGAACAHPTTELRVTFEQAVTQPEPSSYDAVDTVTFTFTLRRVLPVEMVCPACDKTTRWDHEPVTLTT